MIDGPEAARRLGLAQGLLLNDFEAQALSLPAIPAGLGAPIGPVAFGARGPQVILGPGTGLGIGALVEAAGRHTPLASEACHIDFGPVGDEESALWPHLERVHGRVTDRKRASPAPAWRGSIAARMAALGRAEADARRAGARRRGARRSRRRGGGEPEAVLAHRRRASPATWASPSSPPAA